MAHPQQLQFVKTIVSTYCTNRERLKVLEIGSYDVNGSVRKFFPNTDYVGVDLIQGPGVDLVCEGDKIPHQDKTYDIAISCECFEHNPSWAETFINMYRMTKDGGFVIFTCATTGREEHGTTRTSPKSSPGTQALNWDYYKNLTAEDFHGQINLDDLFQDYFFLVNSVTCDLYFFGLKGSQSYPLHIDTNQLKVMCQQDQEELQNKINYRKNKEKYIPRPLRKSVRKIMSSGDNSNERLIDEY